MNEKTAEAIQIYYMDNFRSFMRKMQDLTDEDFKKPVPGIIKKILNAREKDPLKMFERIMKELDSEWEGASPLPVNFVWHHFIVPGVIMASLRNSGYEISDREVEEAISRGQKLPGGSCGFMGTCGGAFSVGIIFSIIKKTNPLHEEGRSEILCLVANTLQDIAIFPRRCCKRSSYIAIEKSASYLRDIGFDKLKIYNIQCRWAPRNKMCLGINCLYFPRKGEY